MLAPPSYFFAQLPRELVPLTADDPAALRQVCHVSSLLSELVGSTAMITHRPGIGYPGRQASATRST